MVGRGSKGWRRDLARRARAGAKAWPGQRGQLLARRERSDGGDFVVGREEVRELRAASERSQAGDAVQVDVERAELRHAATTRERSELVVREGQHLQRDEGSECSSHLDQAEGARNQRRRCSWTVLATQLQQRLHRHLAATICWGAGHIQSLSPRAGRPCSGEASAHRPSLAPRAPRQNWLSGSDNRFATDGK
eukprot:scaffold4136_cov101-Isochrysis_galbana.AAC.6